jgi:glycerol kinase
MPPDREAGSDCVLAIDQGTTSSRAIVFDAQGGIVATSQSEFPQLYPHEGWVEHDPAAIWQTSLDAARGALKASEAKGSSVVAVSITNQRETTLVWDRATGEPVYNAIVWQDRRTAAACHELEAAGVAAEVTAATGLLIDPYFSATKIAWILDNIAGARERAAAGELAFGTVDAWLIWRLTGGRVHATDATNASRTNLFNIHTQQWDSSLLDIFRVPAEVLPDVLDCNAAFGETDPDLLGRPLPILGVAGDQQAAALGQCCIEPGTIKSTYGTGCFVILNTGEQVLSSDNRLLSTVASRVDGRVQYGLEGSIFVAGAAIQWLRDQLGIIKSAPETEQLAAQAAADSDVYVVPAFTGLGAPYWDPDARGAILGLTRASGPAEIVKATLESVAYQTYDLFEAMAADGVRPSRLRVDGGMVANDAFVQLLADMLQIPVDRPRILETTAYGSALLAGQAAGVYGDWEQIAAMWQLDRGFEPALPVAERDRLIEGWHKAVARVRS